MDEEKVDLGALTDEAEQLKGDGRTVVHVARGGRILGLIAIDDESRPRAKAAVAKLSERGVAVAMRTGDNARTAQRIAQGTGNELAYGDRLTGRQERKEQE